MGKLIKNRNMRDVIKNALNGCAYSFTSQKNFIIHFFVILMVLALGIWLEISSNNFMFLILLCILGIVIEMANTAVEKTVDLITEQWNIKAKIAKDVSAGMMLVASIGFAIMGLFIFLPAFIKKVFP